MKTVRAVLPTKHNEMEEGQLKVHLENAGVKFLSTVEGEPMFQHVELPEGWKIESTHEIYHSNLVDNLGRTRATIFCKSAIWDRKAYISPTCRYSYVYDEERQKRGGVIVVNVMDGNAIIHSTDPITCRYPKYFWRCNGVPVSDMSCLGTYERTAEGAAYVEAEDKARDEAKAWLDDNYPGWEKPHTYWE